MIILVMLVLIARQIDQIKEEVFMNGGRLKRLLDKFFKDWPWRFAIP